MTYLEWTEARASALENCKAGVCRAACALQGAIEMRPGLSFAIFSVFYFAVVLCLSSFKLLWLDELITLHVAKLGSLTAIWHALGKGVDPNPPITYLLVNAARGIFGEHEFAYRLPAAAGYWVGLLSLFVYLRRSLPSTWALAGTVLSTTMAAFEYSFECRSYGIFYGLAMLALLCWSLTADESWPRWTRHVALAGLIFALAAGISTNYFAVLAFLPIAAGEMARTIMRARELRRDSIVEASRASWIRAVDLRIWIALVTAGAPLLLYRPLIATSIANFAPYAWNKVSLQQVFDSYTEMVEVMLYPMLALFAFAIAIKLLALRSARMCATCRARLLPSWIDALTTRPLDRLAIPIHEAVAVLFLMAYPILGYIVASIRGGMLSPRFVIPVCFGFAIAGVVIAYQLFGGFRLAGIVLLCFVTAWFICRESFVGYGYEEQKQCFYKVLDRFPQAERSAPPGAPIAIPDPLMALTFRHYAPAALASRVVFPVDFPAIRNFRHDDSPEENLWAGRNLIYNLQIVPLATFQNSADKYLILASDGNWMLDDLQYHRYVVQRLPINTRAGAIGGFTPLAHGTPAFFVAYGGGAPSSVFSFLSKPVPFQAANNLPQAKKLAEVAWGPQ